MISKFRTIIIEIGKNNWFLETAGQFIKYVFFNKSNLRRVGFLLWRFLVRVDLVRRNDSVVCRCNCHVPRQNNACKMKNKILCTLFNFHISKKKTCFVMNEVGN